MTEIARICRAIDLHYSKSAVHPNRVCVSPKTYAAVVDEMRQLPSNVTEYSDMPIRWFVIKNCLVVESKAVSDDRINVR